MNIKQNNTKGGQFFAPLIVCNVKICCETEEYMIQFKQRPC